MIGKILSKVYSILNNAYFKQIYNKYRKLFNLDNTVILGKDVVLSGNISIGKNSYINSGRIQTGADSKVVIGEWCAHRI